MKMSPGPLVAQKRPRKKRDGPLVLPDDPEATEQVEDDDGETSGQDFHGALPQAASDSMTTARRGTAEVLRHHLHALYRDRRCRGGLRATPRPQPASASVQDALIHPWIDDPVGLGPPPVGDQQSCGEARRA
jgi:hypothetical protein